MSEEEEEEKEEDVRIEVDISTFGAAIVALRVPNKLGDDEDVVLVLIRSTSTRKWTPSDFGANAVESRIGLNRNALDGVEYVRSKRRR